MTKPDWCPSEIWEAAGVALVGWTIDDGTHAQFDACRVSVARAILAERERCGKYATDQAEREPYGHCKATARLIADNIMGAK